MTIEEKKECKECMIGLIDKMILNIENNKNDIAAECYKHLKILNWHLKNQPKK